MKRRFTLLHPLTAGYGTTRTFADAGVPAAIEGKVDVEEAGSERALL
jgi:hypothetical protein